MFHYMNGHYIGITLDITLQMRTEQESQRREVIEYKMKGSDTHFYTHHTHYDDMHFMVISQQGIAQRAPPRSGNMKQ